MRSGPLCALLWRILTWCSREQVTQGLTKPAECGSRQAIQARPDHPNRVVSPSRGIPVDMHQVAPTSNRCICNKVQQVTSVHVTSSGVPSLGSRWSQSTLGDLEPYAFSPLAILCKVVAKLRYYLFRRIILIGPGWPNIPLFLDLVAISNQIPLCLPNLPNLLTEPFSQILHKNLPNLNLHAWLLEPQQSWSKAVAARIETPQKGSTRSIYDKVAIFTKW